MEGVEVLSSIDATLKNLEIGLNNIDFLITYIGFGLNIIMFVISFFVGYKIGGAN